MIKPINNALYSNLERLKNDKLLSLMTGDYRGYKKGCQDFAREAIKDFEVTKTLKGTQVVNIPLFSKAGLKALKVIVRKLFSIDSPDEKMLKKMLEKEKLARKYNLNRNA